MQGNSLSTCQSIHNEGLKIACLLSLPTTQIDLDELVKDVSPDGIKKPHLNKNIRLSFRLGISYNYVAIKCTIIMSQVNAMWADEEYVIEGYNDSSLCRYRHSYIFKCTFKNVTYLQVFLL